jgi:GAF domain-containing protein
MPTLHPLLQTVQRTGRAVSRSNQQLLYRRLDYTEEIHEFFSYSPLLDAQGRVQGVICPIYDATSRVINERRLATLADLAASTRATRTRSRYLTALAACLARHPEDLPLAALYLSGDEGPLAVADGQPGGCALAPGPGHLGTGSRLHGLAPADLRHGQPAVATATTPLPAWPTPHWGHPVAQWAVEPVPVGRLGRHSAGLLIGLNPHKRLDADYRAFLALVSAQIGLGWNDAQALEQEAELAQAELARLTRLTTLGELATSIAHEVNQPLTAMVLDANACLRWLHGIDQQGDAAAKLAEARAAAQRIARSGEHAGQVVARIRGLLQRTPAVRAPVAPPPWPGTACPWWRRGPGGNTPGCACACWRRCPRCWRTASSSSRCC